MTAAPETLSRHRSFGGVVGFHRHDAAETACSMRFATFLPPQAERRKVPALWYLAGLTCTEETFMIKAGAQRVAAELGIALIAPDTSPRGVPLPGDSDSWDFGVAAGFYVDATEVPWSRHYRMYSWITQELPALVEQHFSIDPRRQGIFGHSMGGHGAMTIALKNPERFRSCSAFAPIVEPSTADWSVGAFEKYLGADKAAWRQYDACALVKDGARFPEFLIDQGKADNFLENGLRPWLFEDAIKGTGIDLTLRMHERYDHSYYFISSFMDDHLKWHAKRLA